MSDRVRRRKAKREGKPQTITHIELAAMAVKNPELDTFIAMLNEDLYKMHMIMAGIVAGVIDKSDALSIEDVYDLPMAAGFKGKDDLLLSDFAAEVFTRFKLSSKLAKDGNLFESLLVDGDSDYFKFLLKADPTDSKNKDEYDMVYYSAVQNTMKTLYHSVIDEIINL